MAAKRNGAHAPETGSESIFTMASMLQGPAAASFAASQRLALEATRFWARRMRAYADQMETLMSCASPDQFVAAQARFIGRLQEDYSTESAELSRVLRAELHRGAAEAHRDVDDAVERVEAS